MILMVAPAPSMTFGGAPSGAAYVADQDGLVKITNDSVADQAFLAGAGCYALSPTGAWGTGVIDTLSNLYAADTTALLPGITGFPKFFAAIVENDGTSSNNGTWFKTGSGHGSGNWTFANNLATLVGITGEAAARVAETERAQGAEASLAAEIAANATAIAAEIARAEGIEGAQATELASHTAAIAANATAIAAEIARAEGIEGAQATELASHTAAIAANATAIAAAEQSLAQTQGRAGDALSRFTGTLAGAAAQGSQLSGPAVTTSYGAVLRVSGATTIALRERIGLDALRSYRIWWRAVRSTDPTDPAGDSVRFGVQYLDNNKAALSQVIVDELTLTVGAGQQTPSTTIAAAAAGGVVAWPANAIYAVPFIQTYGSDGVTDIEAVDWTDVTDLLAVEAGATEGVGQVAADLATETMNREQANAANAGAIAAEATRAEGAEQANSSAITTETARAEAKEAQFAGVAGMGAPPIFGRMLDTLGYDKNGRGVVARAGTVTFARTRTGWSSGTDADPSMLAPPSTTIGLLAPPLDETVPAVLAPPAIAMSLLAPPSGQGLDLLTPPSAALVELLAPPAPATLALLGPPVPIDDGAAQTLTSASTTVLVPAAAIDLGGSTTFSTPFFTITSPLPSLDTISGEAVAAGAGTATWLRYEAVQAITSITWADSHTPAPVLNLDYTEDLSRGLITNQTAAAMTVSYTAYNQRKDIISVDRNTLARTITLGTPYPRAAEYWKGAAPVGDIVLGEVFNRGDRVDYMPTWQWRNGVNVRRRAQFDEWLNYCRSRFAHVRRRLLAGSFIRVVSLGDSRDEMGGNGPFMGGRNTHPNSSASLGISRDVPGYYALLDGPTRARLGIAGGQTPEQLFDFGDGLGAIHSKCGQVWEMLKLLEGAYGFTFTVPDGSGTFASTDTLTTSQLLKFSIGGTDSSNSTVPSGSDTIYNGGYPARLNLALAAIIPGRTLFINSFGMNERGHTDNYPNYVNINAQALAAGADVLHVSTIPTDPRYDPDDIRWRYTCREAERAARDKGWAYYDPSEIVAPENLCGLGLSPWQICDVTLQNHDGFDVQRANGARLVQPLLP